MKLFKMALAVAVIAGISPMNAQAAYLTFFGEDLNNSATIPLATTPNASAAETNFLANLSGVGTESFESIATGTASPLTLNFPGFGGSNLTAELTGGNGKVVSVESGTAYRGRYSVPSATTNRFWEVAAGGTGNFTINFGQEVAALGFYGVDIGDFGGQLQLQLFNGATEVGLFTVPNSIGSSGSTDGSVLYFGLIAQNASEVFTSVTFLTTTGQGDIFAFDSFTVGQREQVVGPNPVPEPGTLALLGLGLVGLGALRRRKLQA